ncbi:integrase family domain protein [Burkholderia pseudomallei MSHR7334]|nr:integrase family domain protein [Burkholderia pseudomallei MSHR7334]
MSDVFVDNEVDYVWDFARYLQANQLVWNQPFRSVGESVVSVYRDWQASDLKLEPGYINRRLMIVANLYRWAVERGMLDRLPFTYSDVRVHGIDHDLAHITGGVQTVSRPDMLLDEWEGAPKHPR